MATINLTVVRAFDVAGIRRRAVGQYTGPVSYVTGGDSFTPQEVKLGEIEVIHFGIPLLGEGTTPRLLVYDYTTHKVRWFIPETGLEVAATTDLSGKTTRFEAVGK